MIDLQREATAGLLERHHLLKADGESDEAFKQRIQNVLCASLNEEFQKFVGRTADRQTLVEITKSVIEKLGLEMSGFERGIDYEIVVRSEDGCGLTCDIVPTSEAFLAMMKNAGCVSEDAALPTVKGAR